MRKVLKWTFFGLLGLVGLVVVIGVIGVALGSGGSTSSASSSSGGQSQAEAAPSGEKRIKVVVSSTRPVDVTVDPDDLSANAIEEKITGQKTYQFDMSKDAGLVASASTPNMSGNANIHVAVYENGKLRAEDYDGAYAQVSY